jgi:hypothetical protein
MRARQEGDVGVQMGREKAGEHREMTARGRGGGCQCVLPRAQNGVQEQHNERGASGMPGRQILLLFHAIMLIGMSQSGTWRLFGGVGAHR